ncbi:hypothetical protein B0T18DRAFT_156958 [Schizothecium vesticola]|uniref:Uncharacterized protein n=1 Tax=Schizothecium vesticola TaxID=314040 RepID=A0AA40EW51_9PEZI|nr:hypothetical protein B0T18DRAFT_156958 [Schizothecium vesticola]
MGVPGGCGMGRDSLPRTIPRQRLPIYPLPTRSHKRDSRPKRFGRSAETGKVYYSETVRSGKQSAREEKPPSPVSRNFPWLCRVRIHIQDERDLDSELQRPPSSSSNTTSSHPPRGCFRRILDHWLLAMYAPAHILEHIYPHCMEYAETSGQRATNRRRCQQSSIQRGQPKKQLIQRHIQRKGGGKTVSPCVGVPSIGDRPETGRSDGLRVTVGRKGRWVRHGDLTLAIFFLACEQLSCSHRKVDNRPHVSSATTPGCRAYASRPAWWTPTPSAPRPVVRSYPMHARQPPLPPHRQTSTYLRAPVESRSSAPLPRSGLLHL